MMDKPLAKQHKTISSGWEFGRIAYVGLVKEQHQ